MKKQQPTKKSNQCNFVTVWELSVAFIFTCLFTFFINTYLQTLPLYGRIMITCLLVFTTWHKLYQIIYDIKLMLLLNRSFDKEVSDISKKKPVITFIIPSYEEPFSVAKMTFDSIVNIHYNSKKEIIVVDNSLNVSSEDFRRWRHYVENFNLVCPEENITTKFIYNEITSTLKPGNLDLAQKHIEDGELIMFLDVDSTLPESGHILDNAVAQFDADEKLGFLQFKIKATNSHFNILTRGVSFNQDLLRLRQITRGYGGYKIFEGHNGIWRRTVLDQIGDWTEYYNGNIIITEDILKSAYVYEKGYYGKPLNMETGEWVPSSLLALEGMWMRWVYGNCQVLLKCFSRIYSSNNSLIEKFDISFHMLQQVATVCLFLMIFIFQLVIPGPLANILVTSLFVVPQLVGAIASYVTCSDPTQKSKSQQALHLYSAFFLIELFIMSTQIKSTFKFILRVPQGWKVTEKGVETSIGWIKVLQNNTYHLMVSSVCIGVCAISWIRYKDTVWTLLFYHVGLIFMASHLILCIVIFGMQGRKLYNKVNSPILDTVASDSHTSLQ